MAMPEQVWIDVLRSGLLAGAAEPIAHIDSDRLIMLLEIVAASRCSRSRNRQLDAALCRWDAEGWHA